MSTNLLNVKSVLPLSPTDTAIDWEATDSHQRLIRLMRDLPYGDLIVAITLARSRLQRLNKARLDAARRAELTRLFHYAYSRFCDLRDESSPLDVSARLGEGAVTGFIHLCEELASAYLLCLDALDTDTQPLHLEALHFALFFQAQAMLHRMIYNMAPDASDWARIHRLYTTGERHDLTRTQARFGLAQALPTLHDQYIHLLLVAGANPYALNHEDSRHVVALARLALGDLSLQAAADVSDGDSGLGVRLDQPSGPVRLRRMPASRHRDARILSTRTLCTGLDTWMAGYLDALQQSGRAPTLSDMPRFKRLSIHLTEAWSCQRHRANPRETSDQEHTIVFGIAGICRWLRNGGQLRTRHFAERVTSHVDAQLTDSSPTGFRFSVPSSFESFINAGDVFINASLRPEGATAALGITRWAQEDQEGRIILGAMRLDATLEPVEYHDAGAGHDVPAVVMRRRLPDRDMFYLLTGARQAPAGNAVTVTLQDGERQRTLRLGQPVMTTDLIRITVIEPNTSA